MLSKHIGIGEGSTRMIVECMKDIGLVEVYQTGVTLSECGTAVVNKLPIIPVDIKLDGLAIGRCQEAVVVKGVSEKVGTGQEQRDIGVRAGALGCTTIVFRNGNLMVPPDWDLDKRSHVVAKNIRDLGCMEKDDILIIGSSDVQHDAMVAAVSAAISLI
jgi:hypothetical protein